ncbi:hypothetical protein B4U79_18147 [Dinothrombium tinctorium]|uniref:Major facilitator superfamily (MFS) profile domain-containing protein n=1 Tax=Dinothrombium tinctorium TaxID=1965070 RepID=A0A3S3PPT7_9ACAR|nr:hypothetical protein B4U79_18292 [Dinothrombium tinctorium]RWS08838.1 hypothetical protein B4U79_18147 [Dinothrombium tinctorium]
MVVPILPDYINRLESSSLQSKKKCDFSADTEIPKSDIKSENAVVSESENSTSKTTKAMLDSFANISFKFLGSYNRGIHLSDALNNRLKYDNISTTNGWKVDENAEIGFLFSSKALMQLLLNPFVGKLINRFGYCLPQTLGSAILLLSSLIYAFGENFALLFMARSIHGMASAFTTISSRVYFLFFVIT